MASPESSGDNVLLGAEVLDSFVFEERARPITWQPDSAAPRCCDCKAEFSLFTRRHHCRGCGLQFCDACSRMRIEYPPEFAYQGPQRACENCYILIIARHGLRNAAAGVISNAVAAALGVPLPPDTSGAKHGSGSSSSSQAPEPSPSPPPQISKEGLGTVSH
jgi:hypothetical protein